MFGAFPAKITAVKNTVHTPYIYIHIYIYIIYLFIYLFVVLANRNYMRVRAAS
jgi:hypothetical protein